MLYVSIKCWLVSRADLRTGMRLVGLGLVATSHPYNSLPRTFAILKLRREFRDAVEQGVITKRLNPTHIIEVAALLRD